MYCCCSCHCFVPQYENRSLIIAFGDHVIYRSAMRFAHIVLINALQFHSLLVFFSTVFTHSLFHSLSISHHTHVQLILTIPILVPSKLKCINWNEFMISTVLIFSINNFIVIIAADAATAVLTIAVVRSSCYEFHIWWLNVDCMTFINTYTCHWTHALAMLSFIIIMNTIWRIEYRKLKAIFIVKWKNAVFEVKLQPQISRFLSLSLDFFSFR